MRNEEVAIGDHCWAVSAGSLLVVLKDGPESYQVCGEWEGGIGASQIDIIEVIPRPKGHEATPLYYLFGDNK